ncbi:hypothetical protein Zm00014a_036433 [Zea mays]|uniref:Uncharacterized protein n=1 Tax=Zea mays TaxID=4577 RepID=A0A3L6EE87_MAIZE|nr:hypothetical protein Zm00014a_036433 [Zea mays]
MSFVRIASLVLFGVGPLLS